MLPIAALAPLVQPASLSLVGHRSIVNQVRYSNPNCLIATSGVEKIIKLWSPFPMVDCKGGLTLPNKVPVSFRLA